MNQRTIVLALAAATTLSTWGLADNKPPAKPAAAPATQPTKPSALANQAPEDAAMPSEMHHRHVALRHITLARDLLKETKDGGEERIKARTTLNLALNQLYKSMNIDSPIDDTDDKQAHKNEKAAAYSTVGSAAKWRDKLPPEHRELHAVVIHLQYAHDVLSEAQGGERKDEALEKVDQALALVNKALADLEPKK